MLNRVCYVTGKVESVRDFISMFVTTEHPPRQDTHRHSTAGMESGCKLGNTRPGRAEMLSWAAPVQTQDTPPPPPTLQLTTLCAETQAKQGADRKWSVTRQHLPLLDRALLVRYLWTSSGDWDHWAQDRTLHYNPLPAPAQQLFVSVCLCL